MASSHAKGNSVLPRKAQRTYTPLRLCLPYSNCLLSPSPAPYQSRKSTGIIPLPDSYSLSLCRTPASGSSCRAEGNRRGLQRGSSWETAPRCPAQNTTHESRSVTTKSERQRLKQCASKQIFPKETVPYLRAVLGHDGGDNATAPLSPGAVLRQRESPTPLSPPCSAQKGTRVRLHFESHHNAP